MAREQDDTVATVYAQLRTMAVSFAFKPGERINESALSRNLGASRTPLREALNRLVAEGFVDFEPGKGFRCRALSDRRIAQLYEARMAIECEAARQAALRASAKELERIEDMLHETAEEYETCTDAHRLMELDEAFHLSVAGLSENDELLAMLRNIYDKIRFVRTADLRQLCAAQKISIVGHHAVLSAIRLGDPNAASDAMRTHIGQRIPFAAMAVRLAFADLYAPEEEPA